MLRYRLILCENWDELKLNPYLKLAFAVLNIDSKVQLNVISRIENVRAETSS